MTRTVLVSLSLSLALSLVAGCKKPAPVEEAVEAPAPPPPPAVDEEATAAAVKKMHEQFARVHFETDSDALDAESQEALTSNVAIMQEHPTIAVQVQGHADERGTSDYNIALGDRRANAVRTYMVAQGLAPARVTVISYGEERPVSEGSGEGSWSQNRRAEFKITSSGVEDDLVTGTVE